MRFLHATLRNAKWLGVNDNFCMCLITRMFWRELVTEPVDEPARVRSRQAGICRTIEGLTRAYAESDLSSLL